MSRARGRRQAPALAAVPEEEAVEAPAGPVAEIMQLLDGLEAAVDLRVSSLMSAAEDAVMTLKNECKRLLLLMPAKTRKMQLADFQKAYPGDLQAGALEEIRERCAAMAAAAAEKAAPATGRGGRTAAKRGAEPETVLRTVRARRGPVAPPPKFSEAPAAPAAAPEPETGSRRGARSRLGGAAAAEPPAAAEQQPEPATSRRGAAAALPPAGATFGGMPLQTPMPFAGEAVAMPITLLTQKRQGGGRTRAAPVPDAAVITTADGKQWALGADGVASIPESHRQEVMDTLTAQFNFFAAALGKTVFSRDSRRGRR